MTDLNTTLPAARCTTPDKRTIRIAAALEGVSMSEFIRRAALERTVAVFMRGGPPEYLARHGEEEADA
jgi:uncharacterized protein (DUF1778 family)